MVVRITSFWLCLLSTSSIAWAQTPPYLPSNEPNANQLLADRVRFVREMYSMDRTAAEAKITEMMGLVPFQEKYMKDITKTVYRLELAMTMVMNSNEIQEAEKPGRQAVFQSQLQALYAKSPLSLANVIKMVEQGMSQQNVTQARAKIATRFADQLKGAALNVDKIDALLMPTFRPAAAPTLLASIPTPPPEPKPAEPAPQIQAQPSKPMQQPTPAPQMPQPLPQPKVPPQNVLTPTTPTPPKPLAPAPPLPEWSVWVEKAMTQYGFTADQKTVAEKALRQCKDRAQEQLTKVKGELDEVAKMSDEKARASRYTEVNKPIDTLYDELVQRVQAVATAEQKAKAEKAAATGK